MASALPTPSACPDGCDPITTAVPGPTGAAGAAGTDGTDGVNAYTTLGATLTMPAHSGTVTATVASNVWMAYGQIVAIGDPAGAAPYAYMRVGAKTGTTQVVLTNLETGLGPYSSNVAPGTVFPSGTIVSPGGLQGPAGADGTSGAPDTAAYVITTANASLPSAFNLATITGGMLTHTVVAGVSTISTATEDVDYAGASDAQFALKNLTGAADKLPYFTGANTAATTDLTSFARSLLDDTTNSAARTTLGCGTIATQAANAVAITGGSVTGITDLAVADGGTGASTAAAARTNLGLAGVVAGTIILQNQQPSGTDAGTFTSGAWQTRVLNTEVYDDQSLCTLAANEFTLAAGEYYLEAFCPAYKVNRHQARLLNVTTASVEAYGTNSEAVSTGDDITASYVYAHIDVPSGGQTFRIEHRCETTKATDGFGLANSFGGTEVYTTVVINREL